MQYLPRGYDDGVTQPLSAADIEAVVDGDVKLDPLLSPAKEPVMYLGRTEVAYYLGLAGLPSLTGVELPPPDAVIGDRKGWTTETIDAWKKSRPGRGRWGPRPEGAH